MTFADYLRFRRDVSWWLMHRWPRNPFLVFADLLCLLIDLVVLPFCSRQQRYDAVFSWAFRLDCLRERGRLPPASPRAITALRRVIILTYEDLRS